MTVKGGTAGAVQVWLGGPGPQIEPIRAKCRESASSQSEFHLEADVDFAVSAMYLGRPARIRFVSPDGRYRHRMAVVQEVQVLKGKGERPTRVRLALHDPLSDLCLRENTRLFLEASPATVVEKLLDGYPLLDRRFLNESEGEVLPQSLQVFERDYRFLHRLLCRHQLRIDYRDEDKDTWRFVLRHARAPHVPAPRPSFEVVEPGVPLTLDGGGLRTAFDHCGEEACLIHGPDKSIEHRLNLSGTVCDMGPGRRFQLSGPAVADHLKRRAWVAWRVETDWSRADDELKVHIVAGPAEEPVPLSPPPPKRLPSFFQATVESSGRYAEPDEQGRYRIRYGFDREARARAGASPPISILSPYAGPLTEHGETGWHFPLQPGGRLLLSCLNDDPEQPVVVGYLTRRDEPGPVTKDNAREHVIETRRGHGLSLNDDPKAERIVFQALDGKVVATLGRHNVRNEPARELLALANQIGAFDVQAGRRININVDGNAHTRASGNQATTVQGGIQTEAGTIHEQSGMQWMAVSQKQMNLDGRQMQVKGDNIKVGAKKLTVRSETIAGKSGRHIIVQAEGKLHIRSEQGPIWLGTEKAGFLLEPNKITIKARNLKLNARKGIMRKGKHDRRNETTDVQAPEAPRIREIESVPRVEGAHARLGHITARWASPQVKLDQTPIIQLFARGLPDPATLDVRVRRRLGDDEVELDQLAPELSAGTHGLSLDCQIEDKAAGPAALKIVGQDARDRIDFTVTHDNETIESIDALHLQRPIRIKLGMSHKPGLPLQAGTLKLKDINGHTHEAAIEDGEVEFDAVPVGRFQLSGLHADRELALAITRVNDCHVPPGTTPWLCENDLNEFVTELEIHVLREPILLNLRNDASEGDRRYELTSSELAYFKDQGNATIFIHGYNVGLGQYGRLIEGARWQDRTAANWERIAPTTLGKPIAAYKTREAIHKAWPDVLALSGQDEPDLDNSIDPDKLRCNGDGAHDWLLAMEYQLNRAAGFDGEDYGPFTRLIGVAWDGDHGEANFWDSEMAANRAGRRLLPVLRQLVDEGVKVNVITHSLGARVILTALNVRGETSDTPLDQVILWQPAIDQHALSNEPEHAGPLGHETFPHAGRGAARFVILHSDRDGILSPSWWSNNDDRPEDARGNMIDRYLGYVGGAYPRKYMFVYPDILKKYFGRSLRATVGPNRHANRRANAEARQISQEEIDGLYERLAAEAERLRQSEDPSELDLLLPWAGCAEFDEQDLIWMQHRIYHIARGQQKISPTGYVALGAQFPDVRKLSEFNRISQLVTQRKLDQVDQSGELYSHSGMRFPSQKLFEEVFQKVIWSEYMKTAGFGRY